MSRAPQRRMDPPDPAGAGRAAQMKLSTAMFGAVWARAHPLPGRYAGNSTDGCRADAEVDEKIR